MHRPKNITGSVEIEVEIPDKHALDITRRYLIVEVEYEVYPGYSGDLHGRPADARPPEPASIVEWEFYTEDGEPADDELVDYLLNQRGDLDIEKRVFDHANVT